MKHFKCTESLNTIMTKDSIWQAYQILVLPPRSSGQVILFRKDEDGNIVNIKIPEDIFELYFEEVLC